MQNARDVSFESKEDSTAKIEEIVSSSDEEDGYKISQDFKILNILGKGSFGKVYSAYSYEDKKNVAIKMIKKKEMTPSQLKILRDEEFILNQLDHPNIIRFHLVILLKFPQFIILLVKRNIKSHNNIARISFRIRFAGFI